jgi:hypothetical protein
MNARNPRLLPFVIAVELMAFIGIVRIVGLSLIDPDRADWLSYRAGAERLLTEGSPYSAMQAAPYALHDAAGGAGFVYPPPAAIAFMPTLLGDWTFHALNLLGVVAFVLVTALIGRREGLPMRWVAVLAGLALLHPGFQEIQQGQISPLVAAGVGAMWLAPTGYLAVLTGMVKVYPGLGIMWAARMGGPVFRPLLFGLGVVAATFWLWPGWIRAMLNARSGCPDWSLPSLSCATGGPWVGIIVALGLAVAAWRIRGSRCAFLLLTLAMIAPAPDLYWGYLMVPFVGALPPLATLIKRWDAVAYP